ncbi:MAG: zinc-ribbon domain-containing protein [Erysipelotrichales bacterium]|jgi:predicted amidophosphoribosyltransferase|nr:zinc-ribbon domain-containing protein [Erysipelotrichales bacterium]
MAKCAFCGAELPEKANFCLRCGGPVLKPGEKLEPIVIEAPEGAEVIISDGPPEFKPE